MTLNDLIDALFPPGHPKRPTPEQEAILRHPQGPAWVLAGPGSGKTEVLNLFVLRLLYVEQDPAQATRTPPEAIFVTTFTEKAARNLEDRISHYRNQLVAQQPALAAIDISKLHLGTLHGLRSIQNVSRRRRPSITQRNNSSKRLPIDSRSGASATTSFESFLTHPKTIRGVKPRIPPIFRMGAGFVVPSLFEMDLLCRAGRKVASSFRLDLAKAAVFIGIGHGLHDTPPIFQIG